MTDLLVLGGGIAGLTAALRAVEADPTLRVVVLERSARLGGKIRTLREEGFWVDIGPDVMVARRPEAIGLCREVGLESKLRSVGGRTLVQSGGRLHALPAGWSGLVPGKLLPLLTSPLLPVSARLRAALEPLIAPRLDSTDESLESFFVRRVGRTTYEHLIEPLVGGLYGTDVPVSIRATLPHLHDMEQKGGLVRAWRSQRSEGGVPFMALDGGMAQLPEALAAKLEASGRVEIRTGTSVSALVPTGGGFRAETPEGAHEARAVVVALTAPAAARVLAPLGEGMVAPLGSIPHGSVGAVGLAYRTEQIAHPLREATGFVIPKREGGPVQAVTLFSAKHPGSAPDGHALFRIFLRPEKDGTLAPLADLIDRAEGVLKPMLGITGAPEWTAAHAWEGAMARFTLGHLDQMEALCQGLGQYPGLFMAVTPVRGSGLPDAVALAQNAARTALRYLVAPTHAS